MIAVGERSYRTQKSGHEGGIALVSTLFVTSMLLLMAAVVSQMGRGSVEYNRMLEQHLEAELQAESTLGEMTYRLETGSTRVGAIGGEGEAALAPQPLSADSVWHAWGPEVRVKVTDLSGRLDPLTQLAPGEFREYLRRKGIDADRAAAIEAELLDWVEADPFRHLNGAVASDYMAEGLPYAPRGDRQLQHLAELRLLRSMDATLYRRIAPELTLEPANTVNVDAMPVDVLLALVGNSRSAGVAPSSDDVESLRHWLLLRGIGHPEISVSNMRSDLLSFEVEARVGEVCARRLAVFRFKPVLESLKGVVDVQTWLPSVSEVRPWSVVQWRME